MSTVDNTSGIYRPSTELRVSLTKLWPIVTLTSMLVTVAAITFSHSYIAHRTLDVDDAGRVFGCETQTLKTLKLQPDKINLTVLASIHTVCYRSVADSDVLTDFGIRKSAYLNQQSQTTILMWMVVAITLSGVVLAGVQLVAGYKLAVLGKAAFDQGGHLSIEHSRISIGSSVTGLLVLTISLAFFTVFVYKVYFIKDPGDAPVTGSGLPAVVNSPQPIPGAASAQMQPNAGAASYGATYGLPGSQPGLPATAGLAPNSAPAPAQSYAVGSQGRVWARSSYSAAVAANTPAQEGNVTQLRTQKPAIVWRPSSFSGNGPRIAQSDSSGEGTGADPHLQPHD
jgi:hypothetical protein